MANFGILLQYADRVRSRLIEQQKTFSEQLDLLLKAWPMFSAQLPLARYQVPTPVKPCDSYTVVAADSSPLELSRHRAVELKAVSLSRVWTDYQNGTEKIDQKIIDFAKDDIATLSNPLIELEYALAGEQRADLVLIDGSLIRWQWEQLDKVKKEELTGKYVQLLIDSYQKGAPVLAVIDRSQGKDVVDALERLSGGDFGGIVDEDLFDQILAPGEFSPVYMADSPILKMEPRYKIGFVYYKSESRKQRSQSNEGGVEMKEPGAKSGGGQVLRVEFLLEQSVAEETWGRLVDQAIKGRGFPFVIARAHDTCVVKNKDKKMLEMALMKYGRMSQKERLKQLG